jgi:hypothetical protein
MDEFCTCGAQLPPDALFCHKCGKPQREILQPEVVTKEEEEAPPPPPPTAPREGIPLNFHNAPAVRIALIVAAVSTVVSLVLPFLNWIVGGFAAVFLYRRRTGVLVNTKAGMKMGWITGVLAFALYIIPFAVELPRMSAVMEQRLRSMPGQDPALMQEMLRFIQSGPGMATVATLSLMAWFLIITFLSMAGGALGAKLAGGR